ncbi:MAG: SEC-C domain-containing protein [Clostridia bacterium]|nr:SEC-C domain-containing protein [Clostridia bacterium]
MAKAKSPYAGGPAPSGLPEKTPEDLLMTLSVQELHESAMRLDCELPVSKGKRALAETIVRRVREVPYYLLSCLGIHSVEALLEQRRELGLRRSAPWTCPLWMANDDPELLHALEELRLFGMARRTRSEWILNKEMHTFLKSNKDVTEALTFEEELYGHLCRILPIYGLLTPHRTAEAIDRLLTDGGADAKDDKPTQDERQETLLALWVRREGAYGVFVDPAAKEKDGDGILLRDPEMTHPEALLELHRQMRAAGQTERFWESSELVSVLDSDVLITAQAGIQLQALCDELRPDPDDLVECMEDAVFWLHEGDRTEALMMLEDAFPDAELTTSQRWILSRILDKIPLPQLMGRTIDEVNRFTVADGLRIRADDPCPCGSGKRYGKCHGKLH